MVRRRQRRRDEQGAILVTTAVLLVGVATLAGLALAGGAVYAVDQEGRRAADVGALAAAAALPTINVGRGPNPLDVPVPTQTDTPLGPVDATPALPTLGQDLQLGGCQLVGQHFAGSTPSPATAMSPAGKVQCTQTVSLEDPWLQRLAECLAGVNATLTCADDLQHSLTSLIPAPDATSPVSTELSQAIATVGTTATMVTSQFMAQLQALNTTLGGQLTPLVTFLQNQGGIDLDPTRLAPALLTPQVSIEVEQPVDVPGAGLLHVGPVTVRHTSTARRAFKDAVIVPAVTVPGPDGSITFDPNPKLAAAGDAAVQAMSAAATAAEPYFDQAFQNTLCFGQPSVCPTPTNLLQSQLADLHDIADPPSGPPDVVSMINNAIATGTPVILATPGYLTDPHQILSSTVWALPGVSQLLPGLLLAPALDIVPAVLSAGPLGKVVATPIDTVAAAGQSRGLYRARLIK